MNKQIRVFILGAGCSKECGYPLAKDFVRELENFQGKLPNECPKITQSVNETVKQFRSLRGVETLDQLAARIEQDLKEWKWQRGSPFADSEYLQREKTAADQILNAKIATSAIFLAKEEEARQTHLSKYKNFITQIVGGPPWEKARNTTCYCLTFNYDRLFEIAFSECFPTFDMRNHSLYSGHALNSGLDSNYGDWRIIQPMSNRFCFLKLHGSAGWWAKTGHDERRYWPAVPVAGINLDQIEKSIPDKCGGQFGWHPLLAFPHERQESQEYFSHRRESCGYAWAAYIDAIWQHAASLVASATELRIIGYSFNPIDSRYMINQLLTKATCEKIVIQNKTDVRKNLDSYEELQGHLEYDPTPFGE